MLKDCPICESKEGHNAAECIRLSQAAIENLNSPSSLIDDALQRATTWTHYAKHLEENGKEAPALRENSLELEERRLVFEDEGMGLEFREAEGDEPPKIVGYASVFGKLSVPMGFGREKVKRGAFLDSIRDDDVRALWNHDSNLVLGRMKSGTLKLSEDRRGLKVEISPPLNFQFAETIKRGDVDGMSIRFTAQEQKFDNLDKPDETVRTILKAKLTEVSPVTFPAFPDTAVAMRSVETWREANRLDLGEVRGEALAAELNRLVDARETDARPRSEIVAAMARAAGISVSTVNQIMNGSIICPPLNRLAGLARGLGTSAGRLRTAAERDGCDYDRSASGECELWRGYEERDRRIRLIEIA